MSSVGVPEATDTDKKAGKPNLRAVDNTGLKGKTMDEQTTSVVTERLRLIPETTEKLLDGPEIVRSLHNEHRYLSKLLEVLHEQLDAIDEGLTPDYSIMKDVLTYMHEIVDHSHHPRENLLYQKLLEQDRTIAPQVEQLLADHADISKKTTTLLDSLRKVMHIESIENIDAVRVYAEDYLQSIHAHIDIEESVVLPHIIKTFNEQQWRQILADVQPKQDPIFGRKVNRHYQNLYDYLQNRTAMAIEDFTLANFIGLTAVTETIGMLAQNVVTAKDIISNKAKITISNDKQAFARLAKAENVPVSEYVNTTIDCVLDGYDTWAECMADIGVLLRRTKAHLAEPYSTRLTLFTEITKEIPERRKLY